MLRVARVFNQCNKLQDLFSRPTLKRKCTSYFWYRFVIVHVIPVQQRDNINNSNLKNEIDKCVIKVYYIFVFFNLLALSLRVRRLVLSER